MSENDMKDWVFVPEEENRCEPVEVAPAIRVGDFMVRDGEAVEYVGEDTVVYIPDGITNIGSFLFEGKHVTEVHIPSTVTEMGVGSFLEAPDLKNIFVDEANPAYKSIDGCLYDKSEKTFIRCPSDRESVEISEGTEKVESCAFFQCSVKEIKFPSTLKLLEEGAFMSCSIWERMDELIPPYGVELGKEVFMYSTLPPRITLQGVTKLPERAFANATFGAVRLPDTLTEIGDDALCGPYASRVYMTSSVAKIGDGVFSIYDNGGNDECWDPSEDPSDYVYSCPDGFVLGVDNEECAAAQYARENNIPYEIVTDVENFLNVERPQIYHIYKMRMKDRNKQTDGDELW